MSLSTVLRTVYASAPTGVVIIPTLEVRFGVRTILLAHSYEDVVLGVQGEPQTFEACGFEVALPSKDTSGNQLLTFSIGLVDGRAFEYVMEALEAVQPAYLVYREYLSTDRSQPARAPVSMVISGGQFDGSAVQIEASYYDLLNTAWPRERYTADKAPGVKYMA